MSDGTKSGGVNPAQEDISFDELPPTKTDAERNDPEAFLAAVETDEARPDNADGIGDEPTTTAAHDPIALADQFGALLAVELKRLRESGHTGLPDCPACAKTDAEDKAREAEQNDPEGAPDISVPGARMRFHALPARRYSGGLFDSSPSEGSPGFILVVDNAEDADDPDVQANWLGIATASGALTLIISPDEIDLGGGLAEIADLARAMTGRGKH